MQINIDFEKKTSHLQNLRNESPSKKTLKSSSSSCASNGYLRSKAWLVGGWRYQKWWDLQRKPRKAWTIPFLFGCFQQKSDKKCMLSIIVQNDWHFELGNQIWLENPIWKKVFILSCWSACLFFGHVAQGILGMAQDVVGTTLNLYAISIQSGNILGGFKMSWCERHEKSVCSVYYEPCMVPCSVVDVCLLVCLPACLFVCLLACLLM